MLKLLANLGYRECLLLWRHPAQLLQPLLFFVIIASLFPLAISPDPRLLMQIAPGVMWMGILFALLLSFSHLFSDDYLDGSLEQLIISCHPLSAWVLIKVILRSLMIILPMLVLLPCLSLAYALSGAAIINLLLAMLLAVPSMCLLGALGASVILSLRNGTLLLALILLPLYVPILIFASAAVVHAQNQQSAAAEMSLLAALLVLLSVLLPAATSYCLRAAVEA